MDIIGIILIIVLFLILIVFFSAILIIYNNFVRLKNNIDKSLANIDVLLKQRTNEIPNLVKIVQGYMKHEKETLESLTKARSFLLNSSTLSQKAAADNAITNLVKSIFAIAENYPDLKAGENFLKLQKRISGLENELADRREFYNDSVTIYNTRIQSIPDLIVARMMHLNKISLFKAKEEDKKYVKVNLLKNKMV
jgi:LemA protein